MPICTGYYSVYAWTCRAQLLKFIDRDNFMHTGKTHWYPASTYINCLLTHDLTGAPGYVEYIHHDRIMYEVYDQEMSSVNCNTSLQSRAVLWLQDRTYGKQYHPIMDVEELYATASGRSETVLISEWSTVQPGNGTRDCEPAFSALLLGFRCKYWGQFPLNNNQRH